MIKFHSLLKFWKSFLKLWLGQQNTKEIRFTGGANKHKLLFGFLADEALLRKSSVLAFQGFVVWMSK